MNINLVVRARNSAGEASLRRRFKAALDSALHATGGEEDVAADVVYPRIAAFSTSPVSRVWNVPSWQTFGPTTVAFTMPPVPIDFSLHDGSWRTFVHDNVVTAFHPERFSPNYFGMKISEDSAEVWTDHLGLGRCYYVANDDFFAFSNHIGALTHFLLSEPELDEDALALFVLFGWYTGDSSPIRGIRRLGPAQHVVINAEQADYNTYLSLTDLYVGTDETPDFEATAAEMMTVNANLSTISDSDPTVFLSGGRDSRMTCGTWIGAGGSANVVTYGDLPREAEIARELMSIFRTARGGLTPGVDHEVKLRPASNVTMTLDERLANAFSLWDGDAALVKIRGNIRPSRGRRYSVSGIGGEITHGYFYGRPGMVERINAMASPMDRLKNVYGRKHQTTPLTAQALEGFFDQKEEAYRRLGLDGFPLLDYFYVEEKLRRWSPQTMSTVSPVPLCTPAYQRMAFRLSLEQQVSISAPGIIADIAVPGWGAVPTYKASAEDSGRVAKVSPRIWTTDPERFSQYLDSPEHWPEYVPQTMVDEAKRRIAVGEMTEMYESWLLKCVWIDESYRHVAELARGWRTAGLAS